MPSKTNLNVFPYFDDFDEDKNYYKVLFKPGYPIQARELSNVQSILQNQIEQFGNHVFKEGSVVIPGNISFTRITGVEVQNTFNAIDIDQYINNAKMYGYVIVGRDSGLRAKVVKVLRKIDYPDLNNTLVYFQYLNTGTNNETEFQPGESLYAESEILPVLRRGVTSSTLVNVKTQSTEDIFGDRGVQSTIVTASRSSSNISGQYQYENVSTIDDITLRSGQDFLLVKTPIIGSAAIISEGVYFLRGNFVNVAEELLVVDRFSFLANAKIGLSITEQIITSDNDSTLFDNSRGFSNYAAPGADRLKITARLASLDLDDDQTDNFIELTRVEDGNIVFLNRNPEYNELGNELARRTYDGSGDYYITPFTLTVEESLNDLEGSRGVFKEGEVTREQNTPKESMGVFKLSPGKAYVKGYEIERLASTLIDFEKPRDTKTLLNQSIQYAPGTGLTLNRLHGTPKIGISTYHVSLRDSRLGSNNLEASGKEIGLSRVYDFALESGAYNTSNLDLNEWDLNAYDLDFYTEITLNQPVTETVPSKIDGKYTGAFSFLRFGASNAGVVTAYSSSGRYSIGEKITFSNGETRVITNIRSYGIDDTKSVYGNVGLSTFTGDLKQSKKVSLGSVAIQGESAGVSTVTSPSTVFTNICEDGDLVSYTIGENTVPNFAKIQSVSTNSIVIEPVQSVSGICIGTLPVSTTTGLDFAILTTERQVGNNALYTPFPKQNIESVDLSESRISIRREYSVTIAGNGFNISASTLSANESFQPYDEERYSLVTLDGTIIPLESGNFAFSNGGREVTLTNLTTNGQARFIASLYKSTVKSRAKVKKIEVATLSKSSLEQSGVNIAGVGATTLNDGLVFGNYPYGTRVQDDRICLNHPEIIRLYGVFESRTTEDPILPKLTITNILTSEKSPTTANNIKVGERLIGSTSECVLVCTNIINPSTIEVVSVNKKTPSTSEAIKGKETGITAEVVNYIDTQSVNITDRYLLESGETSQAYTYSFLKRVSSSASPKRRIKVVYDRVYIPSDDAGDVVCVNSYSSIPRNTISSAPGQTSKTDILDLRPIPDPFLVYEGQRSPFEFFGKNYSETNNSFRDILVADEDIILNYTFYLGRVDRIFLDINEQIIVKKGVASESLDPPESPANALEIARVTFAPYAKNARKAADIQLLTHKRYRMSDISKLENRIKNLEYYTTLNLLEQSTSALSVPDSNGLNRFKSGFFVDDFSTRNNQYVVEGQIKNSNDKVNRELRPACYTTELDLTLANNINYNTNNAPSVHPVKGISRSVYDDVKFTQISNIIGNNIQITGGGGARNENTGKGLLTLAYNEEIRIRQSFSTRVVNVTPYLVTNYYGQIDLNPSSDVWSEETILEPLIITGIEGRVIEESPSFTAQEFASQDGFDPVSWGSWRNNWTGSSQAVIGRGSVSSSSTSQSGNTVTVATTTTSGNVVQTTNTGTATQQGTTTRITNPIEDKNLGNRVVSASSAAYLRSRNVEFIAKKMKPSTRLYAFFDDQDVTALCTPKLLEIEMVDGSFTIGEDVIFYDENNFVIAGYRCAAPNHQYGNINDPNAQTFYDRSPYDQSLLPTAYTESSNILNVDTTASGDYSSGYGGNVLIGARAEGVTSGAVATISNKRLFTDQVGVVIGSLFVPNPNDDTNQRFTTGAISFKVSNDQSNDIILGVETTEATGQFFSSGFITQTQETTIQVRNTLIESATITRERAIVSTSTAFVPTNTTTSSFSFTVSPPAPPNRHDPLAQSFFIPNAAGVFVTHMDLYFQAKSEDLPVYVELRSMELGLPTTEVYPLSRVELLPSQVNISDDAAVPTRVNFQGPVYLEGNKEHCIVLLSDVTDYYVWISRLGETTFGVNGEEIAITTQNELGSLFKSQNGSTWSPSQYEDLKFTLFNARFVEQGSVTLVNSDVSQVNNLYKDPLKTYSKTQRVSLGATITDTNLRIGNTIYQEDSNASGVYIGNAGIATGNLSLANAGIGYTPFEFGAPAFTFEDVPLVSLTGDGKNATADITIDGGVAIAATIVNGGSGYVIGEELTASQLGISSVGRNLVLSVTDIFGINQIIMDEIQGDFNVSPTKALYFYSNDPVVGFGTTTINALGNGGNDTDVTVESIETVHDGLHIEVIHKNHGMHSLQNRVLISGVESDVSPATLVGSLSRTSTEDIELDADDISVFEAFENIPVSAQNPGYISIGNEIISYTGVTGSSLTGIGRDIDTSSIAIPRTVNYNPKVYKYEYNGISLRRINKEHFLQDATVENPIGLDKYNIKIDTSTDGVDRSTGVTYPKLFLAETKSGGGPGVYGSKNIAYEMIHPIINTLVLPDATLTATVRTTTGTSIDGNEESFLDAGTVPLTINEDNYFESPRVIASRINELAFADQLPGNKSLEITLNLSTDQPVISPIIDLDRLGAVFVSNRVNNPISDYINDSRTSSSTEDPTAFTYQTKPIQLEFPATSIKVLVEAYINQYTDVRAFFAVMKSAEKEPIYYPFPGFRNRLASGEVIDITKNDGTPDKQYSRNNALGYEQGGISYVDLEFNIDNLEPFNFFSVKLLGTSTNQAFPPRFRDLRVIGLA
jgi:hypothetical protein